MLVVQEDEGAAVIAPMRQGQRLIRRSALKDILSSELPRSAGARVAACSTLRFSHQI